MERTTRAAFALSSIVFCVCFTSCNRNTAPVSTPSASNSPAVSEAPENSPAASEPVASAANQPDPQQLLRESADYLGKFPAYSCKITTIIDLKAPGMNNRQQSASEFRLQRPNRMAMISDPGSMGITIISDGEKVVQYVPTMSRYAQSDAPATLDELMSEESPVGMMMMGPAGGLIPYGGEKFFDQMNDGITDATYVGTEEFNGQTCHLCEFQQDDVTWKMWIESGDRPVPRKMLVDMSAQMAAGGDMFKDATMHSIVTYTDWEMDPKFAETDFTFDPPEDATEVEDLLASLMQESGAQNAPLHPLLGEAAPSFKAQDLDGSYVDMKSHFENEIVILDFWATWCGPCVEAMPEIAAVAEQYADRGVRLFAVNVGEGPDEVKEFLKASELDVNVLLDSDGQISSRYQANAIPQTVLVGKSGIVEVVHIGMSGNLKEQLSGELDQLIAGEKLAEKTLAEANQENESPAEDDAKPANDSEEAADPQE